MALAASTRFHDVYAHFYLPKIALIPHTQSSAPSNKSYHIVRLPLEGKCMDDGDALRLVQALNKVKDQLTAEATSLSSRASSTTQYDFSIPLLTELHLGGNPRLSEDAMLSILETLVEMPGVVSRLEHVMLNGKPAPQEEENGADSCVTLSPRLFKALKGLVKVCGCLKSIEIDLPVSASEKIRAQLDYDRLQNLIELNRYPKVVKHGLIAAYENDYRVSTLDFSESFITGSVMEEPALTEGQTVYPQLPADVSDPSVVDSQYIEGLPSLMPLSYGLAAARAVNRALCSDCVTVVRLDFSKNCIGDESAKALCQILTVNTTLTELSLNSCQIGTEGGLALIQALDSSNNQSLTELNVNDNHLNDLVGNALLNLVVKQSTKLGYIGLDTNPISQNLMSRLSEELMLSTQPPKLKEIVPFLYSNHGNQTRVVINQSGADRLLTDTSARVLLHALRNNTQVVYIDLSNNELTDDAAIFLAQIIEGTDRGNGIGASPVKKMILQSNQLTNDGAKVLLEAVSYNSKLELLDLRFQNTEPGISQFLLDQIDLMVELNKHPQDLRAIGYKLITNSEEDLVVDLTHPDPKKKCTNDTIAIIRRVLDLHRAPSSSSTQKDDLPPSSSSNIRECLLGGNSLFVNYYAIPDLVTISNHVRHLDLSGLDLKESEFVSSFVPTLRSNTTLTRLNISKNSTFTDATIGGIVNVMRKKNHTIMEVVASGCKEITSDALDELAFLCGLNQHGTMFKNLMLTIEARKDHSVTEVVLKGVETLGEGGTSHRLKRTYTDDSIKWLVRALSGNDIITKVDITGNAVTDASAELVAKMIKENAVITHLNISYNHFTDEGLTIIGRALKQNSILTVFKFEGNRAGPNTVRMLNNSLTTNVAGTQSGGPANNTALYGSLHARAKPAAMTPFEHAAHLDKVLEQAILEDAMLDKERVMQKATQLQKKRSQ